MQFKNQNKEMIMTDEYKKLAAKVLEDSNTLNYWSDDEVDQLIEEFAEKIRDMSSIEALKTIATILLDYVPRRKIPESYFLSAVFMDDVCEPSENSLAKE